MNEGQNKNEPMRGLKKTALDGAQPQNHRTTDRHGDSMTESAQLGRFSEKSHIRKTLILLTDADSITISMKRKKP